MLFYQVARVLEYGNVSKVQIVNAQSMAANGSVVPGFFHEQDAIDFMRQQQSRYMKDKFVIISC